MSKDSRLDERDNYYLSLEKVLEFIADKRWTRQEFSKRLPIEIDSIEYTLRYRRAYRIVEQELQVDKISKGEAKEVRSGSFISYSVNLSQNDREYVAECARKMAESRQNITSKWRHFDWDLLETYIGEAVSCLKNRQGSITETVLPDHDGWRRELGYYEPKTLAAAILRLYALFVQEYKVLVEVNFPTLRNHFQLYSQMPVHYFVSVEAGEYCPKVTLLRCDNTHSNTNEVTLGENIELIHYPSETFIHSGNAHKVLCREGLLARFMISHFSALRTLVYEQIQRELKEALESLK